MKVSGSLCGFVILLDMSSCSKPSLVLKKKKKEQHHVHMAKQDSALFMDKFITGYNFQVDAGNIFSAAEPLKAITRLILSKCSFKQ